MKSSSARFWFCALLVLGVALAALGAAGFDQFAPEPRQGSWLAFLGGLVLLVVGGTALSRAKRRELSGTSGETSDGAVDVAWFDEKIATLASDVADLDRVESETALHARIGTLLEDDLFEITRRHEELAQQVGFAAYARVWDGLAGGERLLARAWSMLTDGFPQEARAELPLAQEHLRRAVEAARQLNPSR